MRESELGADGSSGTVHTYTDRHSPAGSDHSGQLGADNRGPSTSQAWQGDESRPGYSQRLLDIAQLKS